MWYPQKGKKSSKRAQFWVFNPTFSKFRAFRMLHPHRQHAFLEFLVENKELLKKRDCVWAPHTVSR